MRLAVFTIAANPFVAQAQVLLQTVRRFLPLAESFLILADERHPAVPYPAGCSVIAARELGIADFAGFSFRYDRMEFAAALKPLALLHLLGPRGYTHCLYFDPDIELFSPLPSVMHALAANASLILTPQILAPAEQRHAPNDTTMLREGVFNLGFLGVSGTAEARNLLAWWARWLRWRCVDDRPIGLFVDQKFMDLAPGFGRSVHILHDPGLNVGPWNVLQRQFDPAHPAGPQAGGGALGFFHYHGFDTVREHTLPLAWREFLAGYAERLLAAGHGEIPPDCYAYGRFASGVPIPTVARRLFRDDYAAWAGDPFHSFERWCHLPALHAVTGLGTAIPSLVMQWLHARSPELAAFSLSQAEGVARTTRWWLEQGPALGIDRRFLEPQALAAGRRALPLAPSCPAPEPGRADVTLIAADGPARPVAQAVAAGLRLAVESVEELDGAAAAANGRWVGFCLPLEQLAAAAGRARSDGYRVFIPSGERVALSPESRDALGQVDEVWAPTRFIQAALVCETDRPVLHMPVAWQLADAASVDGAGEAHILAVGDGLPGCGELRAALRAYQLAFARWPAAPRLVIQAGQPDAWDDELASMVAATEGVSVAAPDPSAPGRMSGAACVLSLHRGEALGLPVLRAMACGVPVVATDYGGCTDLLTPQTGFPVEYRLDGGMAEVDPRHAAWWLQRVFDRPEEARRRAATARRALASACDPARVAGAQAQRLQELGLLPAAARSLALA